MESTKLAYPAFADDVVKIIAKNHYDKGTRPKMRIALKSIPSFDSGDILAIAKGTTPLGIAGIESFFSKSACECCASQGAERQTIVENVTMKVLQRLKDASLAPQDVNTEPNRPFRDPVLEFPNLPEEFVVESEAGNYAVGGILSQKADGW
eukprot:gene19292-biopygen16172